MASVCRRDTMYARIRRFTLIVAAEAHGVHWNEHEPLEVTVRLSGELVGVQKLIDRVEVIDGGARAARGGPTGSVAVALLSIRVQLPIRVTSMNDSTAALDDTPHGFVGKALDQPIDRASTSRGPRRTLPRLALAFLAVAAAQGGTWFWSFSHRETPRHELVLYGNVDIRQVELAFNASERIVAVLVEEGDRVEPGRLLARLDAERYELAVARAEAQLETQRQVVARLEAGTREEEVRKAKADFDAAEALAKDGRQTYERLTKLVPRAATPQQADDAKGAYDAAVARVNAAQAALDLAIAGPRKEDLAEARALRKRYEAELGQARHDLKETVLISPSDGTIENRLLEVGDMASPQKPIYTLALTDPVWVRAYVPEPQLGKLRHGMKAVATTDSFPGKRYEGWIGFISPTAEFTPKPVETVEVRTKLVYEVRVFINNHEGELRLGMPATVEVPLDQPPLSGHEQLPTRQPSKSRGQSPRLPMPTCREYHVARQD